MSSHWNRQGSPRSEGNYIWNWISVTYSLEHNKTVRFYRKRKKFHNLIFQPHIFGKICLAHLTLENIQIVGTDTFILIYHHSCLQPLSQAIKMYISTTSTTRTRRDNIVLVLWLWAETNSARPWNLWILLFEVSEPFEIWANFILYYCDLIYLPAHFDNIFRSENHAVESCLFQVDKCFLENLPIWRGFTLRKYFDVKTSYILILLPLFFRL